MDAVNSTWQPALQNCLMDSKGLLDNAGTICLMHACNGSLGISHLALCVSFMSMPSGFWIVMGLVAMCLLHTSVLMVKKCVMHPVSAMAM